MKTFITADPHFGHWGVCKFLRSDGSKLRPWDNPDDMDEALIDNWNRVVGPNDKVYVLGDLAMRPKPVRRVMPRLNGRKVLIKGNHDIFKLKEYTEFFYDVRAYHVLNGVIYSHIPIHPESVGRFGCNVHGHLHANRVMKTFGKHDTKEIDPRYYCVSVEHTDYTPIEFGELQEKIVQQGGEVGFRNGNR